MNLKSMVLLIAVLMTMSSCENIPLTKDRYLSQYDTFMEEVQKEYNDFDANAWTLADAKFKKFSRDYYDQFYDELSKGEQMQLRLYRLDYLKYKALFKGKKIWEQVEDAFL